MMKWSKVEEIIPFLFDNQLDVIYNTEKIFTHAQVLSVLDYTYESFSFRHKATQSPMAGFTAQFWGYSNEVAPQYARMLDAIDREYNPISNYEMVESGYDGTKVSDKINTSISDSLNANALASVSNVEDPYSRSTNNTQNGKVKTTQAGSETADNYVNAFDTGIFSPVSLFGSFVLKSSLYMLSRFLLPFGRPLLFPDCPGLNWFFLGGFL